MDFSPTKQNCLNDTDKFSEMSERF